MAGDIKSPKPNKFEKMPKYIKYLVCIQDTWFWFPIISSKIAVFASPNDPNLLYKTCFFQLPLSTKGIDALKGCPALERVEENSSEEPWSAFPRWSEDVLMHTSCIFMHLMLMISCDIWWHTYYHYAIDFSLWDLVTAIYFVHVISWYHISLQ